jgi:hypothetical protein
MASDTTRFITSNYEDIDHKWAGWYWVSEAQAFMRWNDMEDFYNDNKVD